MKTLRLYLAFTIFACIGCSNLTIPKYGHVAGDREPFSPKIKKAILPAGAPSISQGYKPDTGSQGYLVPDGRKGTGVHDGIDVLQNSGTPVLAAAGGIVESSSFGPLFGNQIVIAHGQNDDGAYYKTKYFHLQHRFVKDGATVLRGQQIGTLGMTGILSGGVPHLHFEVRSGEAPDQRLTKAMHPHKYWADGSGMITCFDIEREFSDYPFRISYPVPCTNVRWKTWGQDRQPQ